MLARIGPGRGPGVVVDEVGLPALSDARLPPGREPSGGGGSCCCWRRGCGASSGLPVGDHGHGGADCALELGGARWERQEGRAAGTTHLDLQTPKVSATSGSGTERCRVLTSKGGSLVKEHRSRANESLCRAVKRRGKKRHDMTFSSISI